MYFEVYKQQAGLLGNQWRWRLRSANHEPIASGESYHRKEDCLHAIELIKGTNIITPIYYL